MVYDQFESTFETVDSDCESAIDVFIDVFSPSTSVKQGYGHWRPDGRAGASLTSPPPPPSCLSVYQNSCPLCTRTRSSPVQGTPGKNATGNGIIPHTGLGQNTSA